MGKRKVKKGHVRLEWKKLIVQETCLRLWDVINFIEDSYKKNLKGTLDLSNIQNYWSGSTSSPDTKLNRLEQEKLDEDAVIKALKEHELL